MINNFFKQLSASWKSKKRSQKAIFLAAFFLLFIGIGLFSSINPVSAQDAASTPSVSVPIPDIVINLFTRIMLMLTRFALELMLFILTFVIQVAGYNGFLESEAVNIGWVMVRDLTNMVFVVALLLIAFGTILGLENYEWKQMLFKLISAAVLVNFSRIIAGIIIDIAQVVMITFVNGIAATAGGNFIRAFSLDSIRSFSETSTSEINAEGVFLAALASLFISVTIMVTSGLLLAMLIGRVIILWILIVLSPIAFVLSVLPQTKSYADEWWGQFGKQVITGPVLVFFLWLTLVAVGNGVVKDHFANNTVVPESQIIKSSNAEQRLGIGKATSWDNLINFIVAIAMLIAGIRVTQQLGGFGAEWTSKAVDIGKKVALTASGAYAARWGGGKIMEGAAVAKDFALAKAAKPFERLGKQVFYKAKNKYIQDFVRPYRQISGDWAKKAYAVDENTKEYKYKGWERFSNKLMYKFFASGTLKDDRIDKLKRTAEINQEIADDHTMSTSGLDYGMLAQQADAELKTRAEYGLQIKSGKEARAMDKMKEAIALRADIDQINKDVKDGKISRSEADALIAQKWAGIEGLGYRSTAEKELLVEGNLIRQRKAGEDMAEGDHLKEKMAEEEKLRKERAKLAYADTDEANRTDLRIARAQAEHRQIAERLSTDMEVKLLREIKNLLADKNGRERQFKIAELSSARDVEKLLGEQNTLRIRAEAARKAKQNVLANMLEQQADSLFMSKLQEGFKNVNLNDNEKAYLARDLIRQIKGLREKEKTSGLSDDEKKDLANYVRQSLALDTVVAAGGAYGANKLDEQALEELGYDQEWTDENVAERWLSKRLGKIVTSLQVKDAYNELVGLLGGEAEASAAFRNYSVAAGSQIGQGNRDAVVFRQLPGKPGQFGKTNHKFEMGTREELGKFVRGTLAGWKTAGDLVVAKMKQAPGIREKHGGQTLIDMSDGQIDLVAHLLAGLNGNALGRLEGGLLGDINTSKLSKEVLAKVLQGIAKGLPEEGAFTTLRTKLKDIIKNSGISDAVLDGIEAGLKARLDKEKGRPPKKK